MQLPFSYRRETVVTQMTVIHADLSRLSQTNIEWFSNAPTQFNAPPIATPAADDPISAAALVVLAHWPGVHETMTGMRSTNVAELASANGGTGAIIGATEGDNVVRISSSAGG